MIKESEIDHALSTLKTFVEQKTFEEMAYYMEKIQPKLIVNLKAKKGPFLISLNGETRDVDVVVGGSHGVMPNAYFQSPMKFVKEVICEPILSSQFKFERFEVMWNTEKFPDLNMDSDGQAILVDPRLILTNEADSNSHERQKNSNHQKISENSKVIFCIQIVP